jgi:hypothetical protein
MRPKGEIMLSRLRGHVRNNVVGYLALFFALTGVAYAAGPLKSGDPAGGDLDGTYPNPVIRGGAVDTAKFSSTIPAARVIGQSQQSACTDTSALIPWDVEIYDTANLHSNSTNSSRLTAPVSGIYRISAMVSWDDPNTVGSRALTLLQVTPSPPNSSPYTDLQPGSAMPEQTQEISTELKLAAGDYVEVYVRQDSGSISCLRVSERYFTMSWIAPG